MPEFEPSAQALRRSQQPPRCIIVAGPNGAGKTTASRALVTVGHGILRIINPDTIAAGLADQSERGAVSAGKLALDLQTTLIDECADFSIETTLSGRRWSRFLDRLDDAGYMAIVYYLWMPTAELCVARVRTRVAMGGHGVPDADIRRRFVSGAQNLLSSVLPRAASWSVLDAGGEVLTPIASGGMRAPIMLADRVKWDALRRGAESGIVRESVPDYDRRQIAPPGTLAPVDTSSPSAVDLANRALRRAKAMHRALGVPMAVWRDGEVYWIDPEELPELPVHERPAVPATPFPFRREP